ncbi:uncharacterized protein FIBRA_03683 [Fibroporia radiculosa]|uniref:OPT family small oligopeptide transporter n=1 Tax=Fibroporia radiculosa TaxID=599839 RepID=J4HW45_9APHY|nr:uncharacterized protein FIBRA_03683 [Fibroporia radiculosa]CCM01622.1 predicted protein [Fibroporia radiculosa]
MARPPSSSAGRPYTADRPYSARPTTAGAYFDHDPQFTYSQDQHYTIDEDEDEESEAEDVFAFGPPPTAPEPSPHDDHLYTIPDTPVSPAFPTSLIASAPITFPPPTFDFYAREHHPVPIPGPSTVHPRHPYPLSPVETPPSTDSQSHDDDPYRLRRLSRPSSSPLVGVKPGRFSGITSALGSRGAHISLSDAKEKYRETSEDTDFKGISPTPGSVSFSSMLDVDSQEGSVKMDYDFNEIEEEDSPYPEVRASVSNIDDPEMPVLTLRMWVLGILLTVVSAAANMFFNVRQPAPSITATLLVLICHPVGKLLADWLPIQTYRLPRWLGGGEVSLNPGPWNIKEHALVYMMANVATGPPFAIQATISFQINYNVNYGYWFNVLLVLATQLTGLGLAGMCKRLLVWPASLVWPQNLIVCTLLNSLHAENDTSGGLSRFRYLVYVGTAAFVFYFLPGYLFTALSVFSWVCWIAPNNVPVNQMFGIESGLGMGILTFDWTQISWISSPLMVPWWAQAQVFTGFVLFYWIATPALYYTNVWDLAYFPMLSNYLYDRFGEPYNVSLVLDSQANLNQTAYDNYSPLYLPAAYAMTYLMSFALSTCVIVHTVLYHGQTIWRSLKRLQGEEDDIHAKLMRSYPEVPQWWYAISFLGLGCLGIIALEVWHTGAPIWFLLLALAIPIVYIIPSGYVYSISGQDVAINILAQVVPGVLLPGKPIPNMIFKSFALQTLYEGVRFMQDMKLGHYIKIPPRATFAVQLTSTMMAGFVQCGMQQWMFESVPDICTPHQKYALTCPHNEVFYEASVIWGVIGPTRQFGSGSIYHPELYALIVGVFLPIPFWLWIRHYPDSIVRYINMPIVLTSISSIPPETGINYSSWFLVGFIFQYWIRRRHFAWWSKFNYVTSAALDSGTVISLLVIFFTLEFPKGGISISWWGNNVWQNTADYRGTPFKPTPPGGLT